MRHTILSAAMFSILAHTAIAGEISPTSFSAQFEAARAEITNQPRTFENEALFKDVGGKLVRADRFIETSDMPGDFDGDNDVDLHDYNVFEICFAALGPGQAVPPACEPFDFELDGDVDLADASQFLLAFTGEKSPVMVEAGGLFPDTATTGSYFSGTPGTQDNNALNGAAAHAGYTQDDLWYLWTIESQPADSGDVIFSNESLPSTAYLIQAPALAGEYTFRLTVTNIVTMEQGFDTVTLVLADLIECQEDADCDDGLFCNGLEACIDGTCYDGALPCDLETETCEEGQDAAICAPMRFDFTLDVDDLVGTAGDDEFYAPLIFNPSSGIQLASFQTGDAAAGSDGNDTLTAMFSMGAANTIYPRAITGIETFYLSNFGWGAVSLNVSQIDDLNVVYTKNSVQDITITQLGYLVDAGFDGITDPNTKLELEFTYEATAGFNDSMTCTVANTTAGELQIDTENAYGIESLTFHSTDDTPNTISGVNQNTGTSLETIYFTGDAAFTLDAEFDNTVRTFDASGMSVTSAGLTLGQGTRADGTDTFTSINNTDIKNIIGSNGDDTFILGNTLDGGDADQVGETIDGRAGNDVLQATFHLTLASSLPIENIETLRVNATSTSGFSLLYATGVTTISVEADTSPNSLGIHNVPVTSTPQVWPTLCYRGDGTATYQIYDTVNYVPYGAGSTTGDSLTVDINNRGIALNAAGATTNQHTLASMTLDGIDSLTINVSDGPMTISSGLSVASLNLTDITITGDSNVAIGSVAASGNTITSFDATGVAGNFSAAIDCMNGGTVNLGSGNDTVDLSGSAASSTTIVADAGNDTITGTGGTDIIAGGAGVDTLYGGDGTDSIDGGDNDDTIIADPSTVTDADPDVITTGDGRDTVVVLSVASSSSNADIITDFTTGVGGDQLEFDISSLETPGACDNAAVNFVELNDGSPLAGYTYVSIQELTIDGAASAVVAAANANIFVCIGNSIANTDMLETALEIGGDVALSVHSSAQAAGSAFVVVYSDGDDAYTAVCHAEHETVSDTDFEPGDLTCYNVIKMQDNPAITSGEFTSFNFDWVD